MTIGTAGASSVALANCDGNCQTQFLSEHNAVRTRVSGGTMPAASGYQPRAVPALPAFTTDNTLSSGAQSWANTCTFAHSGTPGRGENIYASAGSGTPTPAAVVAGWSGESTAYTYAAIGDPVNNGQVYHYTQLAWAGTTSVGCGIAHCTTNSPFGPSFPNWDIAVCQYSPAGNYIGQYPYTTAAVAPAPAGALDVDGNGRYDPLTDGLLILRYLFGMRGTALVTGAVGSGATRTTAQIESYIQAMMP